MTISTLIKYIFLAFMSVTFVGCATMSPQKVTQRLDAMNDFELCLAVDAGMDKTTSELDPLIISGAKEIIAQKKLDCTLKREEIIRFLVISLRDEERRNADMRMRVGIGIRGGW
ncbi:hypothetical protein ICN28_02420 [Polynucleobacter sp. 30F-ANTBAC]|uniref:hypothetical protein n=1 Tax=Polynucleobacter sp. 30F-ANTBAC TaxID=2689095 RepID=UPI001C0E6BAB|nr:hypothetical protein [Polynucleobacter sp. 30F-ANTBAC]MBU3599367.1 hypothetical protein [Polynucleobacter sp. 30F-ANTBAC]